jgi:hypothetical protein
MDAYVPDNVCPPQDERTVVPLIRGFSNEHVSKLMNLVIGREEHPAPNRQHSGGSFDSVKLHFNASDGCRRRSGRIRGYG